MKKRDLTPKLILAGAYPTCGAVVGKKCVLHAGGPRIAPHIDPKLFAVEILEPE
jgi:hypothetical protein